MTAIYSAVITTTAAVAVSHAAILAAIPAVILAATNTIIVADTFPAKAALGQSFLFIYKKFIKNSSNILTVVL